MTRTSRLRCDKSPPADSKLRAGGAHHAPIARQAIEVLDETQIKCLEFELEKARNGTLAMPYDRERVWQLEAQLRDARQKVRMRKAKQMAAKLRLKLSK